MLVLKIVTHLMEKRRGPQCPEDFRFMLKLTLFNEALPSYSTPTSMPFAPLTTLSVPFCTDVLSLTDVITPFPCTVHKNSIYPLSPPPIFAFHLFPLFHKLLALPILQAPCTNMPSLLPPPIISSSPPFSSSKHCAPGVLQRSLTCFSRF